jgi:peptide/nickel transport system substrate-binding protein
MITSYRPSNALRLVRNPHFKQWSKDAQPAGYPDTITWKLGVDNEAQVTMVENNQADWMFNQPPADRLGEMGTKYASRVHINPQTAVYYFSLNTRLPPFNDVNLRKALNYAVDRNALVKIYGGPNLAQPTCQILPPNFPGYEPYCPYTKGDTSSGKWQGPDMAKAKQLLAKVKGRGKVAVVTDTTSTGRSLGLYFVSLLKQFGYQASLKTFNAGIEFQLLENSSNNVLIGYSQWFQDYPAASDFINVLVSCDTLRLGTTANNNLAYYCNPKVTPIIRRAIRLGQTDPDAANKVWAEADRRVTDDAPWVAMFNPKLIDFVSTRIGNYQFNPQWNFLIDQAWIK